MSSGSGKQSSVLARPVDDIGVGPCRIDQQCRDAIGGLLAQAKHRHQRRNAGASREEANRTPEVPSPDEIAADGSSKLEPITNAQFVEKIRGYLTRSFIRVHRGIENPTSASSSRLRNTSKTGSAWIRRYQIAERPQ